MKHPITLQYDEIVRETDNGGVCFRFDVIDVWFPAVVCRIDREKSTVTVPYKWAEMKKVELYEIDEPR